MTHDLLSDLLSAFGATVERVVITELREQTFFAELHLARAGRSEVLSCRPSDAVALAIRVGAPIHVDDDLLDAEGVVVEVEDPGEDGEVQNPDELVVQFHEFLKDLRPEDFSG